MNATEIKKALYKERPIAHRQYYPDDKYYYYYQATTSTGEIDFRVPINEMGEKTFDNKLPAQLLIRWLYKFEVL